MRIRLKAIGAGVKSDPFRVNAPTYMVIHHDTEAESMIVDIPDEVHGLSSDDLAHEELIDHETGAHHVKLCDSCIKKAHSHIDERYQEHKGKFRLEFVK